MKFILGTKDGMTQVYDATGAAWISACGYLPSNSWQYNTCYSRGHAAYYGWTPTWNAAAGGYESGGSPYDLTCDLTGLQ